MHVRAIQYNCVRAGDANGREHLMLIYISGFQASYASRMSSTLRSSLFSMGSCRRLATTTDKRLSVKE